jgi:hypothetical protein
LEVKFKKKKITSEKRKQNYNHQGQSCKRLCIQSKTNLENAFEVQEFVKPGTRVETTTNTAKENIKN